MKKIMFIVTLLFCGVFSTYAQKKCKFDYSKTDPFTKKTEVVTKFWISEKWVKCQVGFGYKEESDIFLLGYTLGGQKNYNILVTDSILLITDKGDMVSLYPNKEVPPTPFVAGTQVATNYSIICNLTKEHLKIFSESKITAIKFPYDNAYQSLEVDEGKGEKLQKNASCVMELNQ